MSGAFTLYSLEMVVLQTEVGMLTSSIDSGNQKFLKSSIESRFGDDLAKVQTWYTFGIPNTIQQKLKKLGLDQHDYVNFSKNYLSHDDFEKFCQEIAGLSHVGVMFWNRRSNIKLINKLKAAKQHFIILSRGWLNGLGASLNLDSWVLTNAYIWTSKPYQVQPTMRDFLHDQWVEKKIASTTGQHTPRKVLMVGQDVDACEMWLSNYEHLDQKLMQYCFEKEKTADYFYLNADLKKVDESLFSAQGVQVLHQVEGSVVAFLRDFDAIYTYSSSLGLLAYGLGIPVYSPVENYYLNSDFSAPHLMSSIVLSETIYSNAYQFVETSQVKFDQILNVEQPPEKLEKLTTYIYGFGDWVDVMTDWLSSDHVVILDKKISKNDFELLIAPQVLSQKSRFLLWSYKTPDFITEFLDQQNIPYQFVEDGFLRSVALGVMKTPPFSLTFDDQALHFDAQRPSGLEKLLQEYDFKRDPQLIERARLLRAKICDSGLSKYNHASKRLDAETLYGSKDQRRILVVGQVEDDASIQYGCAKQYTNNDVVMMARLEHPDAQIIYKPHPDVLCGKRARLSNPDDVRHLCEVLEADIPLSDALQSIDHVYTITSLAGFEALWRGISVTTLGCPFYSGWGLTDDRQPCARRTRQLTIDEVFAAAYLLYPQYFDPVFRQKITAEQAFERIFEQKKLEDQHPKQASQTYVIGFAPWRSYMPMWFADRQLEFIDRHISEADFQLSWADRIRQDQGAELMVWGFKAPEFVFEFAKKYYIPIVYVEDGLIRSVQLGATRTPPFSLSVDRRTLYFNAEKASDLEVLLNTFDFASQPDLLQRAADAMERLLITGISKYNQSQRVQIETLYGVKKNKRILVLGQVEDDASIRYGCEKRYNNNDVVMIARLEHPDAQIIYKPHPDVLHKTRAMQSHPDDVRHLCQVLDVDIPLAQAFETIDHVYTITSQGGFEALMRGIQVTTLGCPFYSGWGVTDDRQPNARRQRQLSVVEIFAATYLCYLRYFDPILKTQISLEQAIDRLVELKALEQQRQQPILTMSPDRIIWCVGFSAPYHHVQLLYPHHHVEFLPTDFSQWSDAKKQQMQAGGASTQIAVWLPDYLGAAAEESRYWLMQAGFKLMYFAPSPLAVLQQDAQRYIAISQLNAAAQYVPINTTGLNSSVLDRQLLRPITPTTHAPTTSAVNTLVVLQSAHEYQMQQHWSLGYTNLELVKLAQLECPDDPLMCYDASADETLKAQLAEQFPQVTYVSTDWAAWLATAQRVYTISSDLGLDAALQHKTVVTVGRPDYAGHGFTLDRQPVVAGTNLSAVQYVEELAQKTCWIDVLYKRVLIW